MKKKSGIIYLLDDNTKTIAYHYEQEPAFIQARKVYIHHLNEKLKSVVDSSGKEVVGLKSIDKLTQIGKVD